MAAPSTSQDDPNVKMPAAVRAAAERANELHAQLKDQPTPDQPPVEVTPQGNQPTLDAASLAQPPANPAPMPEPEQQPGSEDEGWEAKYNAMAGRVRKLTKTNEQLQDTVNNLQSVIATMTSAPAPAAPAQPISVDPTVTPEEENDYGKDLLSVVGKKAYDIVAPLLKQQADQISKLTEQVNSVAGAQVMGAREKMLATMDKELPHWREINTNDDFLAWLALPDGYSGVIRHNMLKDAFAAGQTSRVLAFFKGFQAEQAVTTPARDPQPQPGSEMVTVELAELAAPGKAKSAAAPAAAEKPIFTRASISSFYADVAAGKYRGRDTEKDALERQIFAAQKEGRIR